MVRYRVKRTTIWGRKSQITKIFKNSKFDKKIPNGRLDKNAISLMIRDRAKRTQIWDHKGKKSQITKFLNN